MKHLVTENQVALLKSKVITPNESKGLSRAQVMVTQAALMEQGYMLSEAAFSALVAGGSEDWLRMFYDDVLATAREVNGNDRRYVPMYQNFPKEVMNMSDGELFWNAICHYWSNGTWSPVSIQAERPVSLERGTYIMLEPIGEKGFHDIFTSLVSANQSLTPLDREIVEWFVKSEWPLKMSSVIPFKETLCLLAALKVEGLPPLSATDILRIAVHLSGGDVSLPAVPPKMARASAWSSKKELNPARDKFKFKNFTRAERRYLMGLMEASKMDLGEMKLKRERWLRLGEKLHPSEFAGMYTKTLERFDALRNETVVSWYGQVERAFLTSFEEGLDKLSERPGEFVRRLDALIRRNLTKLDSILSAFDRASEGSSAKVLYEAYQHFATRTVSKARSVMIKGARKRTPLPTLPVLSENIVAKIQTGTLNQLGKRFGKLEPLGKVYIDPELQYIPLPTNMRSMSPTARPVIRGQFIPFDNPDAKVIRSFVFWIDENGDQDLDLSATFLGMGKREVLSYSTNGLKIGKCVHSGDVRNRRGNCAEYIDINMADALTRGHRYVVVDVHNYRGEGLAKVKTQAGMMEREFSESNPLWVPSTLQNCFQMTSESSSTLMFVIDLERRGYIYLDVDTNGLPMASTNVEEVLKAVQQYANPPAFSVYHLLKIHSQVRGSQVETPEEADTVFMMEDFKHSYEKTCQFMGI